MNREAMRQQLLLRALWREGSATGLPGWVRAPHAPGLQTYRANAGALAERALGTAFPTVAALVGTQAFAALAREFWQRHAPERGDLAQWGAALPGFIERSAQLAGEPYLADSARLDWLVHEALRAADASTAPIAFDLLARENPSRLRLHFAPGAALLHSAWPVAAIWRAHHDHAGADDRFAPVRAAFEAKQAEIAFVHREALRVRVDGLDAGDAAFTQALLEGRPLADALDRAWATDSPFSFDTWLARALQACALDRIDVTSENTP